MRVVIAAASLLVALPAPPAAAQHVPLELRPGEALLEIEARGVHRGHPDEMTITAGVITTGSTAAEALRQNSLVADRVIEAVRGRGIAPRDVRTTDLRVAPDFERQRGEADDGRRRRIIGYTATNNVELRLRDLTRAPELLDAFLQAGANNVDGPRFSHSDVMPPTLAAQREGIRLAREEAENYAQAMNMRVSRILRVSERGRDYNNNESIVVTGSRVRLPPVEPGELETHVTVWVDFALAPQ